MGCFTFWVLASFQLPCSQLHKLISEIFSVSLTWTKCIILTFSGTLSEFYFILLFFFCFFLHSTKMSDMTHRGCTWWFDFTKSFDPRCLMGGHALDVSSQMEGWLHSSVIMLPVSNTNTQDQMGGYEHVSHVVNWTKKQKNNLKSQLDGTLQTLVIVLRGWPRHVWFLRGKCCTTVCIKEEMRGRNFRHITRKTVSVWIWFHELKCVTEPMRIISTTNLLSTYS